MRKREQAVETLDKAIIELQGVTWKLAQLAVDSLTMGPAKCGEHLWVADALKLQGKWEVLGWLVPRKNWPT